MTIVVIFEQFFNFEQFLAPNLECFTKYDAFCSHGFNYACLRRLRHIVIKRFEVIEKFYSSKALLKMAGWGMHTQHTPQPPWVRPWLYSLITKDGLKF